MILPFSTKFPNGKPTYFIDKIWDCLLKCSLIDVFQTNNRLKYLHDYNKRFGSNWDIKPKINPKRHTIRKDEHNRWKPGMNIHFIINNRSKNFFQFAPVIECKSVQKIVILYVSSEFVLDSKEGERYVIVEIDGRILEPEEVETIAKNDGFDSVDDFFNWFKEDFTGKIIHWTDLKY